MMNLSLPLPGQFLQKLWRPSDHKPFFYKEELTVFQEIDLDALIFQLKVTHQ